MGLADKYHKSQTLLDENEKEGLLIKNVNTPGELNAYEQLNIQLAVEWTIRKRFTYQKLFTEELIKTLHKRMFEKVWEYAGRFRKSDKFIGVHWLTIGPELNKLLNDAVFWIENSSYSPEETAIRFKHRLVSIRCFQDGNGRHSRLMADIIMEDIYGKEPFTWGVMKNDGELRNRYISALKEADHGNVRSLIEFAMS